MEFTDKEYLLLLEALETHLYYLQDLEHKHNGDDPEELNEIRLEQEQTHELWKKVMKID